MICRLNLAFIFLISLPVCSLAQSRTLTLRLQRTVDIALQEEGVTLDKMDLSSFSTLHKVPSDLSKDRLYRLLVDHDLKGYAYLGSAPSKERDFDYVIILSPDLHIRETKVLIYRETFGREIETPRWLRQFKGMTPDSAPMVGEDIDGISGATISARSMTRAIRNALKTIHTLHKADLL